MKNPRTWGFGFAVTALAVAVSLQSFSISAADTPEPPAAGGAASNAGAVPTPPAMNLQSLPALQAMNQQQTTAAINSCVAQQMVSGITNLGQGLASGNFAAGDPNTGSCPSETSVGSGDDLQCESIMEKGRVNPDRIKMFEQRIAQATAAVQCKRQSIQGINQKLSCLMNNIQMMMKNISTMQPAYSNFIMQTQQQMLTSKEYVEDVEAKMEDMQQLLNGNSKTGAQGLVKMKQELAAVLDTMPTEIQNVDFTQKNIVIQRQKLKQYVQAYRMSKAMECFKNNAISTKFRCNNDGNSKPVSPYAYIKCRVADFQKVKTGRIERDSRAEGDAKREEGNIEAALFQQMFSSVPNITKAPRTLEDLQGLSGQSMRAVTPEELDKLYGSSFSSYNFQNFDVRDVFLSSMKYCYSQTSSIAEVQGDKADTGVKELNEMIKSKELENRTVANKMMAKYSNKFADALRVLQREPGSLDTSFCQNKASSDLVSCLQGKRSEMESLVRGTGTNFNLQIRGSANYPSFRIACNNIDSCTNAVQKNWDTFDKTKKAFVQNQKRFVLNAQQQYKNFTNNLTSMTSSLQAFNNNVQGQMTALNAALGNMGIAPLNLPTMTPDGSEERLDKDGLPTEPRDLVKMIGGKLRLPDASGSGMSSMSDGVSKASVKLSEIENKINELKTKLELKKASCIKEQVYTMTTKATDLAGTMTADVGSLAGCATLSQKDWDCEGNANYGNLVNALNQIAGSPLLDAGMMSQLSTGVQGACAHSERVEGAMQQMTPAQCTNMVNQLKAKAENLKKTVTAAEKAQGAM